MLRVLYPGPIALCLSLLAVVLVPACDGDEATNDASSRSAGGEPSTVILDIQMPADATQDDVMAIAKSAELHAGSDVSGAKIEAKHGDDKAMHLSVTVWGGGLESPDAIVAKLRAAHPSLAKAAITTSTHAGAPADEPVISPDADETPDEVKARITQELRDQGIKGEIQIDVVDEPDGHGRRVEVHVEESKP